MVAKFSVLGSCASRDVFNSDINPNYKDYFKIVTASERCSIISLMSNPIRLENHDSIKVYQGQRLDYFGTKCIERDLSKELLSELKNNEIDYLLIDNLFEAKFGILCFGNEIMTNNTWDLPLTEFYKNLNNFKKMSMAIDSKKYLNLYKKNFHLFYDYVTNECNIKLILNKACDNDKYLDNDRLIKTKKTEFCNEYNRYTYELNKIIENNFDVDVIELNILNYPNDVNHKWGSGTSHFIPEYYQDFTKKLNKIIQNNTHQEKLNTELLNQKKEIVLLQKRHTLPNSNSNEDLKHYFTSRVDIKNRSELNNKIEFLSISDNDAILSFPEWFRDDEGQGAVIQSEKGKLDLKIKCVGEGKLDIKLRGVDVKYKNESKPIFIEYTSLECNGKQMLNEKKLVSHDDFYQCDLKVNNEDIMFIHIEWLPFKLKSSKSIQFYYDD